MASPSLSPSSTHLENIDELSGQEYIAWAIDMFGPEFFIEYGKESDFLALYIQLEFEKNYSHGAYDFGKNLCTIYWPMIALSIMIGRALTEAERLELVKLRISEKDFDINYGGFTNMWVDVIRRWWNASHPDEQIVSFLVNDMNMLNKLFTKRIPLVTSLRANREFTLDTIDGVMDKLNYWNFSGPRYGHCRTRIALDVPDNYLRVYRYKHAADIRLCMTNSFESRNCYIFAKESWLSDVGAAYLKGNREGFWNGERPNEKCIRQDAAAMVFRKVGGAVPITELYNWLRKFDGVTVYEFSVMLNKATEWSYPIYTDPRTKNRVLTRGECIRILMSF